MAQYYWLFPEKDCLRWLQPEFLVAVPVIKLTPYTVSVSPCRLLAFIPFPLLCGHRGLALGDPGLWIRGSVIGGNIRVPGGLLWAVSGFVYCLWGPYFHTCQSPTLQNCFGQVMHNLGNRGALIFSSLDFSIPQSLVQTLEFGIVFTLAIVRIFQGWLVWSGAGGMLYPFPIPYFTWTFRAACLWVPGPMLPSPGFPSRH